MQKIYAFFHARKGLLVALVILSFVAFLIPALHCGFEENIAKLLPPTDTTKTAAVAFANIEVKDKIFIQLTARGQAVEQDRLTQAMDTFMAALTGDEAAKPYIRNTLYQLDVAQLFDALPWAIEHAPAYLDFTDVEMDSLTSAEHIALQIDQYLQWLDTDLGAELYDYMGYDPSGILISRMGGAMNGSQRIYNAHLFTADGSVCLGYISPETNSMESGKAGRLLNAIIRAKSHTEAVCPEVEVLYHGAPVMSANNGKRIKKDLLFTIGIALVFILCLIGWALRRPSSNLLLLFPLVYGAVFALALIACIQGSMSVMALGIGAIVMGVALSYSLHMLVGYTYAGSPAATVAQQARPVLMSGITTIGAFAGLLFTDSSLLRDFGLFAALAIAGTLIACLIFMPHFFPAANRKSEMTFRLAERITGFDLSRNKYVVVATLLIAAVCIAFAHKVHFDSDLKHIGYVDPLVERSMALYDAKQQQGASRQYFACAGKDREQSLLLLEQMEHTCDSLRAQGLISGYTRVSAIMPSARTQQARISHWQAYFTPDKQTEVWRNVERACAMQGVESEWFEPFRTAMSADYQTAYLADQTFVPAALMSTLTEQTDEYILSFLPVYMPAENIQTVNDHMTSHNGCVALDPFYYTIGTVAMMHNDFNTILGISALFVLIVLLISYRRLSLALIAFLPMALSWYIVLGVMYLTGHEFNLINIVVSSFIFGIGVDYSIFVMDGYLHRLRGETDQLLTCHNTAILLSATILVICMVSLLFARHPAIRSIGFASLVGLTSTIILTYILTPTLLSLLYRFSKKI